MTKRRDDAPDEAPRPLTCAQIPHSHGESPTQGSNQGQDHRTVGNQRIVPEPGVVPVDDAGECQEEKRQRSAVTEPGNAGWHGIRQCVRHAALADLPGLLVHATKASRLNDHKLLFVLDTKT